MAKDLDYSKMSDEELANIAGVKLSDAHDNNDYSKMSDDELRKIAGIDDSDKSPGILETIGNALSPGLGSMTKVASENPKSIAPALKDLAKSVPRALADTGANLAQMIVPHPFDELATNAAQSVSTPSPEATNAMELAANVIPLARASEAIPAVLKAGIGKGAEAINFIKGKLGEPINVDEKPTAFINKLLDGTSIEDTTKEAAEEVRGKFSNIQNAFGKIYDDMKGKIAGRGYSPTISKNFPGISVATDEKAINPNRFDNKLSSLDLEKYSPDIKKSINKFNQNPSFSQAHDLQSALGKEGASLKTNKDSKDRLAGKELSSLRRSLLKDIDNTFIKNGDQDLLDEYKAIGQQYKVKSAPYVANPTLRNIVLKKDVGAVNPSTIGNLLKKKDAATSLIRGDLSERTKDLLFANEMKGAIKEIPHDDGTSSRLVDRDKLISLYTTADNKGLNYLKTPEKNSFIASLINDVEKEKYKQSMTNKLAKIGKWGAGLGLAGLGLDEIRRKL